MMRLWDESRPIPGSWVSWNMYQQLFGPFYSDMQRLDYLCTLLRRRLDMGAPDNQQFSIAHGPELLGTVADHCQTFDLIRANAACIRLKERVDQGIRDEIYLELLRELIEQIKTDGQGLFIYIVPTARMSEIARQTGDWEKIIAKFAETRDDIEDAASAFAVDLNTAAVFHLMRVLERGIAALAKEVDVPFDRQNWQNILDQIESKIKKIAELGTKDSEKAERLRFLSESAKEFFYFKDGWRNYVSHNRGRYDESQAKSVLGHVRAFMLLLATRL